MTAPADPAAAVPQHVADEELVQLAQPTADGRASGSPVLVDLTAILLKPGLASPAAAVTASVDRDDTTTWLIADDDGQFRAAAAPSPDVEISLLIRTPVTREPAWQTLLSDRLGLAEEFLPGSSTSSGAIMFVRTANAGAEQLVAWCFGQGSRWIRRAATSPRFGLLAALNALAGAMGPNQLDSVGVVGAALAARDGNLRRANLTAAVPTTADAIPRIDTLADVLMAARIRTGHDVLGSVSAGRSLQFADLISSVTDFRRLSALVVELASQDGYREAHGWIDYIVPETDEAVVEAVLERIWRGADDDGQRIDAEIAWWEDLRETGSDHPVTHWLLGVSAAGNFRFAILP